MPVKKFAGIFFVFLAALCNGIFANMSSFRNAFFAVSKYAGRSFAPVYF